MNKLNTLFVRCLLRLIVLIFEYRRHAISLTSTVFLMNCSWYESNGFCGEIGMTWYVFRTVLQYDPKNAKALYKMCQSHQILDTTLDLESALKYITRAKEIAPENKAIVSKFNFIKQTLKTQNKKDRKQFDGLFNRGSLYDDKPQKAIITEERDREIGYKSTGQRCHDKALAYCVVLWGLCIVCTLWSSLMRTHD